MLMTENLNLDLVLTKALDHSILESTAKYTSGTMNSVHPYLISYSCQIFGEVEVAVQFHICSYVLILDRLFFNFNFKF